MRGKLKEGGDFFRMHSDSLLEEELNIYSGLPDFSFDANWNSLIGDRSRFLKLTYASKEKHSPLIPETAHNITFLP